MEDFLIIVAGGRDYSDYNTLKKHLDHLLSEKSKTHNIVIVSGTCRGADKLGERYAMEHGYKILRFFPDWSQGKKAGPDRNREMAKVANACVVCWDGVSRGSKSMIDIAKKNGIPLRIINY